MLDIFKPVQTDSLKEKCVKSFEELILSGTIAVGRKLPPERDLAAQMGVSRPIVHEALVEIAARGLVSMVPRVGTIVNDFREKGSIALFTSLLNYNKGKLEPRLLQSLLDMRALFEVETARLAAKNRSTKELESLAGILDLEKETNPGDVPRLTRLDFRFHHMVAMAGGNLGYPLLLNSFQPVYTNLSSQFFMNPKVLPAIIGFHQALVDAIGGKDHEKAGMVMKEMLGHGEKILKKIIAMEGGGNGFSSGR